MLIVRKVETVEEIEQIYKLRYQVYCLERGFEPEKKFHDRAEMDEYDAYSIHFIAKAAAELSTSRYDCCNDTQSRVLGTARLILNNPMGFPAEKYCELNISDYGIRREQTAEISRFAVSKKNIKLFGCDRRRIVLGLIREMYQESKSLGINYFCAAMGKGLQKLLKKCGIIFFQAGPMVDYHGMRAPYITGMKSIEESVFMRGLGLYRFITASENRDYILTQVY